jgi:hypothetical protein
MLRRLVRFEAPNPTPRPAKQIALEARRQARPETVRTERLPVVLPPTR